MSDLRVSDPWYETSGAYVMIPATKANKRCDSKGVEGFQCQLVQGHKGPHYFWKETALMGWRDR